MSDLTLRFNALSLWLGWYPRIKRNLDNHTWDNGTFHIKVLPDGFYRITLTSTDETLVKLVNSEDISRIMCGLDAQAFNVRYKALEEVWEKVEEVGAERLEYLKILWEMASIAKGKGFQVDLLLRCSVGIYPPVRDGSNPICKVILRKWNLTPEDDPEIWQLNTPEGKKRFKDSDSIMNAFVESLRGFGEYTSSKALWEL